MEKARGFAGIKEFSRNKLRRLLCLSDRCSEATFRALWNKDAKSRRTDAVFEHLSAVIDQQELVLLRQNRSLPFVGQLLEAAVSDIDSIVEPDGERAFEIRTVERVPPHRTTYYWLLDDADTDADADADSITLLDLLPYLVAARLHLGNSENSDVVLLTWRRLDSFFHSTAWKSERAEDADAQYTHVTVTNLHDFVGRLIHSPRHTLRCASLHQSHTLLPLHAVNLMNAEDEPHDLADTLFNSLLHPDQPRRIAVVGGAGTGKTRLVQSLAERLDRASSEKLIIPVLVAASSYQSALATHSARMFVENAVSEFVGFSLPYNLIKWLSEVGHVVLLIDALDESEALRGLRNTGRDHAVRRLVDALSGGFAQCSFVITSRRDFFESDARLAEALGASKHTVIYKILKLATDQAEKAVEDALVEADLSYLLEHKYGDTIRELSERALFLAYVQSLDTRSVRRSTFPQTQSTVGISDLLDGFFAHWQTHEMLEKRLDVVITDVRRELTWGHVAACIEYEQQHRLSGTEARWMVRSYGDLLDALDEPERLGLSCDPRHIPLIESLAGTTETALIHGFLKDHLVAETIRPGVTWLLDRADEASSREPDARIFAALSVLAWITLRLESRAVDLLLTRYREEHGQDLELLPRFIDAFGRLSQDPMPWTSWAESSRLARNWLVLTIKWWRSSSAHAQVDLELDGLNLSALDLTFLPTPSAGSMHVVLTNCNLEFSALPKSSARSLSTDSSNLRAPLPADAGGQHHPSSSKEREATYKAAVRYCRAQGIASVRDDDYLDLGGTLDESLPVGLLGDFVLIPGGAYRVLCQTPVLYARDGAELPGSGFGTATRPDSQSSTVLVPSFLMQRKLVSNRQFATYLARLDGPLPAEHREKTGNPYYLAAWDFFPCLSQFVHALQRHSFDHAKALEDVPDRDNAGWADGPSFRRWLEWPVVYVDFVTALEFARHFGFRLPTEVEIECVFRSMEVEGRELAKVPWDEATAETISNAISQQLLSLFPTDSSSEPLSEAQSAIQKFARGQGRPMPDGLFLEAWEWTMDVWESTFPGEGIQVGGFVGRPSTSMLPPLRSRGDLLGREGARRTYDSEYSASWFEIWRKALAPTNRVLRGASYLVPPKQRSASRRCAMPAANVNHDIGFRCVCDVTKRPSQQRTTGALP